MSVTDFLSTELKVGDKIVFIYKQYNMSAYLMKGTVNRFTPKKVEIDFIRGAISYRKLVFPEDILNITDL